MFVVILLSRTFSCMTGKTIESECAKNGYEKQQSHHPNNVQSLSPNDKLESAYRSANDTKMSMKTSKNKRNID